MFRADFFTYYYSYTSYLLKDWNKDNLIPYSEKQAIV